MTAKWITKQNWMRRGQRLITLVLVLCMLMSMMPHALAAKSVGSSPSALKISDERHFIQIPSAGASFFTGDIFGSGTVVNVSAGSVWILFSENYYTVDSVDYYAVYYESELYHVRRSDVTLLSDEQVKTYVEKNLWKASSFPTLKKSLELQGDVRVYGLQLALKTLGYNILLDGDYGQKTDNEVYRFQKASGLVKDGDAGPLTQKKLYEQALAKLNGSSGSGSGSGGGGGAGGGGGSGSGTGTGVSADLIADAQKSFVQIPAAGASLFTGKAFGSGTVATVPAGTVLMLISTKTYTEGGVECYALYYKNTEYHVRKADVTLLTDAQMKEYVDKNIWGASSFTTLKQSLNLVGDVRVYGLQLALKSLGYLKGVTDGEYGQQTDDAVYKFQKAAGLAKDGDAGPLTQAALYAEVKNKASSSSGTGSGTGTGSGSATSGSLRTKVSVNLRQKASKSSPKLGDVPQNTLLSFYNTFSSGGVTWYQVVYQEKIGWLMGTYVDVLGTGGAGTVGTLTTIDSVNLRKNASTSSARLGVVPRNVTLPYSEAKDVGGITWYKVTHGLNTGWLMGTYVKASGTSVGSGSGSGSGISGGYTVIGSLRITKTSTRVRKAPNGDKTGVVLAKDSTVSLIGAKVSAGKYDWYPVVTGGGVTGYVRSDCATVISSGSGAGSVTISNAYQFVKLPADTPAYSSNDTKTASVTIPKNTIVRLVDKDTFTGTGGEKLNHIFYKGSEYYVVDSPISGGIISEKDMAALVVSLWNNPMGERLDKDANLHGDIRVYAAQLALYALGYYTGTLDGTYGNLTAAAAKNFQRAQKLETDGVIGPVTWPILAGLAKKISDGSTTVTPGGSGGSATVADFGTVNKVTKPTWTEADNGNFWPKYTFATVLDVQTGKVFTIYRTGGSNHPDAVPYETTDTKTMCEIAGFTYPNRKPTSAELTKIVADTPNSNPNYTWPDFKGKLTGVASIGSQWDRRPALLNVKGNVYAVSIYGWPHGFEGIGASDGLSTQKFPNGKLLYENNNYYGCMCIRFYNAKGHGSANPTVINEHNKACDTAYNYAKTKWPTLCK